MTKREELELILELLRKHDLPLSPILEYAIREKIEEYTEMDTKLSDVASESDSQLEAIEAPIMVRDKEKLCDDFTIKNTSNRCFIINQFGEKVFSAVGRLIYINEKMYQLSISTECFMLKNMLYEDGLWKNEDKKIVALPDSELYNIMDYSLDYAYEIEDIVDSKDFENCKLKVEGAWFDNKGTLDLDYQFEVSRV